MSASNTRSSSRLCTRLGTIALALIAASAPSSARGAVFGSAIRAQTRASDACTESEHWEFGGDFAQTVPASFLSEFKSLLGKSQSPVQGFSEALALRMLAVSDQAKAFAEYWISRSLYQAGLVEIASRGFNAIIAHEVSPETDAIQVAALACQNRIHALHPTINLSSAARTRLPAYFSTTLKDPSQTKVLAEAATTVFLRQVAAEVPAQEIASTLLLLKGTGIYETYARGVWASATGRHPEAVAKLRETLGASTLPPMIESQKDLLRMMISRSYYALGQYQRSVEQLRLVNKRSDEVSQSMSELAWAHLLAQNYPEAIGIGIGVQSGWLKRSFTPEALMVSAMALNELCQYPQSLKMIQVFRKEYSRPYAWLKARFGPGGRPETSYYELALAYLENHPTNLPDRVASEWINSPVFSAAQDGLNVIVAETRATRLLGKTGAKEQLALAHRLLQSSQELRKEYRLAKINLKPGETLPKELFAKLDRFKNDVRHYRRLQRAAPYWQRILANYRSSVPSLQKKLVAMVDDEFSDLGYRMYRQLGEIAENNELIEVEILNGASEDIVWQNAHPGYKARSQDRSLASSGSSPSSGDVYNWGESESSLSGSGEVWEDEVDSMKANLVDNCSSKSRYLNVRNRK